MAKSRSKTPELLSPAQVRELGQAVRLAFDERHTGSKTSNAFDDARLSLAAAWASCAALIGDATALPLLLTLIDDWRVYERDRDSLHRLATAATRLADGEPSMRSKVYELATHDYGVVKQALLDWLDPKREDDRRVLHQLASDRIEWVSTKARERLATVEDLPWWYGVFEADPLDGVDEAVARDAVDGMKRFVELRKETSNDEETAAKLLALLEAMPARAAMLGARPILLAARWPKESLAKLVVLVAERDAVAPWIVDIVTRWEDMSRYRAADAFALAAPLLPSTVRRALALELLRRLVEVPANEVSDSHGYALAQVLGHAWPPEVDPKPVVDLLLSWSAATGHVNCSVFLTKALSHEADWPWLRPLFLECLEEGFSDRFLMVSSDLERLVGKLWSIDERRRLAHEVLDRGRPASSVRWAVAQLSDEERLARYEDPVVRPHLFRRLDRGALVDRARADLLAGRLTLEEAARVLNCIGRSRGGVVLTYGLRENAQDDELDDPASEIEPLIGPVTDDEWRQYRRLRDESPSALEDHFAPITYPPGPWLPGDLRFFERACRHALDTKEDDDLVFLSYVAANKQDPCVLPLLEELRDADTESTSEIEEAITALRKAAGLPKEAPEDEPALDPASGDDDW